jgi:hypothetical protein
MAKNKISEYSSTASNNTDIAGINIAEGCAPSGINNAIRELMAQLKDQQTGTDGDGFTVGGAFTSSGGAIFSGSVVMSSTVNMNGTNNIGNTTSSTILSGSVTQTSGSVLYLDAAATTSSAPPLSWSGDTNTGIYRPAADTLALVTGGTERFRINSSGVLIIGSGEATTSVSGNILRAPSSAGTNIAGTNLEITAGNGTGTGGSGNLVFKTADVGSSGSTANTMTQRLLITPKGGFSFGSGSTNYGTAGQVLKSNGDAPPSFGSALTLQTAQTASGQTSIEFTGIPSSAKRITVMFTGVTNSGTAEVIIQLGSTTYQTTGYLGSSSTFGASTLVTELSTTGFMLNNNVASGAVRNGSVSIINLTGNTWSCFGLIGASNAARGCSTAGSVALSGVLDRIRVTTVAQANTLTGGTINIIYE